MAAVTIHSDFRTKKSKSVTTSTFSPSIAWSDETGCHDLSFLFFCFFLILRFKLAFSLSSFTLIKRFFSSSLLSAISGVSSVYMRLLIFLPVILIPACNSSSLGYHMMGSAYQINKQGDNKQPCHTPFSILNQSVVPYMVLTLASWLACRFPRRQVKMVWYSHLYKSFPQFDMIHTVKGFSLVTETEVEVFL